MLDTVTGNLAVISYFHHFQIKERLQLCHRCHSLSMDARSSQIVQGCFSMFLSLVVFVVESFDTFNPAKKPSDISVGDVAALQSSRIDQVSDHCMPWCMHLAFCRWSFSSRTRTHLDLNLCLDDVFFFVVWVSTRRPRPIFPFSDSLSTPQVRLTATNIYRRFPRPGTMSLLLSQSRSTLNNH